MAGARPKLYYVDQSLINLVSSPVNEDGYKGSQPQSAVIICQLFFNTIIRSDSGSQNNI